MRSLPLILLFACLTGLLLSQELDFSRASELSRIGGCARPMAVRTIGKHTLLELSATFPNNTGERAFWDIPMRLDLSQSSGMHLRICGMNTACLKEAQIFLKVDGSWYRSQLSLAGNNEWADCFISKAAFAPDGPPASWRHVELLRICLWQSTPGNLTLFLQKLAFIRPNVSIALIHGNRADKQRRLISENYAIALAHALSLQGIHPAIIEEQDVSLMTLRPYSMTLLPLPEALPHPLLNTLVTYLQEGGKMGLFHSVPPPLAEQMQLPAGTCRRIEQPLIEGILPVQRLLPDSNPFIQRSQAIVPLEHIPDHLQVAAWWMTTNAKPTQYPALLFSNSGFWMTQAYLNQAPYSGGAFLRDAMIPQIPDLRRIAAWNCIRRQDDALPFIMLSRPASLQQRARSLQRDSHAAYLRKDYPLAIACAQEAMRLLSRP